MPRGAPSSSPVDTRGSLRTEWVRTAERLEALAPDWSALCGRCADATPFQSPEWLLAWWHAFGNGDLWTLALWHDERLVGLVPLYRWIEPGASRRRLRFVGTGNTDHLDAILDPEFREAGAAALVDEIQSVEGLWDRVDLEQLPETSPLVDVPLPWQSREDRHEACPVLRLKPGADERGGVPAPLARRVAYYRRRLEREGRAESVMATRETFEELFDALVRIHGRRWRERGEKGVLDDARALSFLGDAARRFLAAGALRLHAVRLDGRVVAAALAIAGGARTCYYIGGFEPRAARFNVGTVVVADAIDAARRDGVAEFDFLRGREPYKYAWGARDRVAVARRIWRHARAGKGSDR